MPVAEGTPGIDLDKLLERAVKLVYKDKADDVLTKLGTAYAATYGQAVTEGYGKKLFDPKIAFDSPDANMIRHLMGNVYEFSFAKSHQQLAATTAALYDPKTGHIRPYKEFAEVAKRINNEMSVKHLPAEYNTAVAAAQMASRWVTYQEDKDQFPQLTYKTAHDNRVRPTHAALDGVTRPIEDAFWKEYYPPNGWNCRCDVIQATGRKASTPVNKIPVPEDVPALFKTNMAEGGMAFPPDHPFFQHLPDDVLLEAKGRNPFLYEKIYTPKDGSGYVYDNALHDHGKGWKEERHTAQMLADNGEKIILLPELNSDTAAQRKLRDLCLPAETKPRMNADSILADGQIIDLKYSRSNTINSVDTLLRKGAKQADQVCVRLSGDMKEEEVERVIRNRMGFALNLKEVWILNVEGALKKWLRTELL